jgi:hypothetical protein
MKPVLLLETRTEPMGILTSRSLTIDSISSQGLPIEFCYDYQELEEQLCYGQSYVLLATPRVDLLIKGHLGEEEVEYVFTL